MKLTLKSVAFFFMVILLLIVFLSRRDIAVDTLKKTYAQPPSSFISIDDMDIHYRDEGPVSDSLPLVLMHGTGASLHTFDDWTNALKQQKRVVRMDLPAFGLTGPFPNRTYTIEHYVAFLDTFLTAKGIKKCILAGNSLGGQIAWAYTAFHPNKVDKLILIDAAGYPYKSKSKPIAFTLANIPIANTLLTYITPRFMIKKSIENVYADPKKITPALIDRYFDLTLREGNRQAFVDRMQTNTIISVNLLKNIQQPTLILWGEQDDLIPIESAYRFQKDIPHSSLVILKQLGHVPMEEGPNQSLKPLLSFLKLKL